MTRGTKRHIVEKKNVDVNADIHNRFDIEIVDSVTGRIRNKVRAYNLICNSLWTELEKSRTTSNHMWFYKITYGRGNGTPASEDSDLFSTIDSVQATDLTYGWSYENSCCWIRKSIHIDELTSIGETISEIGIRSYAGVLCTHAMLQDMNGNQISIQKGDTDILNIYATVYVHFPKELVDINNAIQVDLRSIRTNYSFIRWLAGDVNSSYYSCDGLRVFNPLKGRFDSNDSYVSYSGPTPTQIVGTRSYEPNIKKYTLTGRCPYDENNGFNGIGWWTVLSGAYSYRRNAYLWPQVAIKAIPPVFNGSKIVQESIGTGDGVTVDFATNFDYPINAKVYVDGVLSNDVVVENVPLKYNHMGQYFEAVVIENGKAYPTFTHNESYGLAIGNYDNLFLYDDPTIIFYNPNYQYGISSFTLRYYKTDNVAVSDDLINWDYVAGNESTKDISSGVKIVPEEHRYKKYWRFVDSTPDNTQHVSNFVSPTLTGKNIHFTSPPAEGAVITIDYDTPIIAKDKNHVFDLSLTLQLGEYIEE